MTPELEISRDKDCLLKCKDCPRKFITKIMFEYHSSTQHKKDTETKPDQLQILQNKKVERDFQTNIQFEECSIGDFVSPIDVQLQRSKGHPKLTPHQCSKCKKLNVNAIHKCSERQKCLICNKSFVSKRNLKHHIDIVHKKLNPYQCQECKKCFGQKLQLQSHINIFHRKLTPYQCQECKKSFGQKLKLQSHTNIIHKKLTPYQCQECKKYLGTNSNLQIHINAVHKKFNSISMS